MIAILKKIIKFFLYIFHIDVTKNMQYDRQTLKIMRKALKKNSNCVDVGCHKGEILEIILKYAPEGVHYAFEPIPFFYEKLDSNFASDKVHISSVALSDNKGTTTFNYIKNAPAFSGLKQRQYDVKKPDIEIINVQTDLMDYVIPPDHKVDFIKIDVEGAEYFVLQGAKETIKRSKPTIIFEFGKGASDYYNINPEKIYSLLTDECNLKISTLKGWLAGSPSLNLETLKEYYESGKEWYYIAHA